MMDQKEKSIIKLTINVRITRITGVMDMEGLLFYRFHLYHITNKKHGKIGWRFHRVLDSGEWGMGLETGDWGMGNGVPALCGSTDDIKANPVTLTL
jgi:hypothetical protein